MEVNVLEEAGLHGALLGLSLSRKQKEKFLNGEKDMLEVAYRKSVEDNGENKFLESIMVQIDVIAPRYWWQQFDTYRAGVTKQSESSMFESLNEALSSERFEGGMDQDVLDLLTAKMWGNTTVKSKKYLPEGFLQERVVTTNYKVLRHIYQQRKHHPLKEWHIFFDSVLSKLSHPKFITDVKRDPCYKCKHSPENGGNMDVRLTCNQCRFGWPIKFEVQK